MKILKVDYRRGRVKVFISDQKLKIEFSLFYPTVIRQLTDDISPKIQGRIYGPPRYNPRGIF
jgi:hypothetical protein